MGAQPGASLRLQGAPSLVVLMGCGFVTHRDLLCRRWCVYLRFPGAVRLLAPNHDGLRFHSLSRVPMLAILKRGASASRTSAFQLAYPCWT